jgi:hypothetical protein
LWLSTIIAVLAAVGTLAITLAGTILNELFASVTDRFKDFISAPPETLGFQPKTAKIRLSEITHQSHHALLLLHLMQTIQMLTSNVG